jgi:hypothetical protein
MAETLVNAGYDPEAVLMELGLPAMPYVGTVSAQPVMVEPEEPEDEEMEDEVEDD